MLTEGEEDDVTLSLVTEEIEMIADIVEAAMIDSSEVAEDNACGVLLINALFVVHRDAAVVNDAGVEKDA